MKSFTFSGGRKALSEGIFKLLAFSFTVSFVSVLNSEGKQFFLDKSFTFSENGKKKTVAEFPATVCLIGVCDYFVNLFSFEKWSFVILTRTDERRATAIKFGIAIRPLNVSAISHTRPTSKVVPIIETNE